MNAQVHQDQAGVAVITVLLIVALMTTMIAFLMEKQGFFNRHVEQSKGTHQAYAVVYASENWILSKMREDQVVAIDHAKEKWWRESIFAPDEENEEASEEETGPRAFIIDGITVDLHIDDLQGRFNLNNLRSPASAENQKKIFLNILKLIGVEQLDDRKYLHGAVLDWIDAGDGYHYERGTESADYTSKSTPYFAADKRLTSIGELRYIAGFNRQIIQRLEEYICVLPIENAKININTANEMVLAALIDAPTPATDGLSDALNARNEPGFQGFDVEMIKSAVIASAGVGANVIPDMMQSHSEFYQLKGSFSLGPKNYKFRSIVQRPPRTVIENPDNPEVNANDIRIMQRMVLSQ